MYCCVLLFVVFCVRLVVYVWVGVFCVALFTCFVCLVFLVFSVVVGFVVCVWWCLCLFLVFCGLLFVWVLLLLRFEFGWFEY